MLLRPVLGLLISGCATSFDITELPARDAGGIDLGVSGDAPAGCGAESEACCVDAGFPCAAGMICSEGRCLRCPGETIACSGLCVDTLSNASHCGACGRACPMAQSCVAGSCALACPAPLAACRGSCVDLTRNPAHCGACGRACAATETCVNSACTGCPTGGCSTTCARGSADCDNNPMNGCETNINDNVTNCGACGTSCLRPNVVARCANGRCEITRCAEGFADCDGMPANGCETDTRRNAANCGACGNACRAPNATPGCVEARCVVTTCNESWGNCDENPANGCETRLSCSPNHCGSCGHRCDAALVCCGGQCRTPATCMPMMPPCR